MAKLDRNKGINEIRGHLNGWVYRRGLDGKLAIAPMPKANLNPPSAGQLQQRQSFEDATTYAKYALGDAILRPVYERAAATERKPIFALAVRDFFTPPRGTLINARAYHGHVGEKLVILATD